ncbi:MAG: SDR family NAD(P)-dependent oxidoreductase, partial [Proteobacteria bacterium]|nr:SDR family NAD(P)-dependent oxidoreductase [Pseudomonadota bacterium]
MFKSNAPIKDWSIRRVWVIGASEGIGLALAHALIAQKSEIIVSSRSKERLNDEFSGIAKILPMDVTSIDDVASSIDTLIAENILPDTVFWLPALYHPGNLMNLEPEATLKRLQTNIFGAFNVFPRI